MQPSSQPLYRPSPLRSSTTASTLSGSAGSSTPLTSSPTTSPRNSTFAPHLARDGTRGVSPDNDADRDGVKVGEMGPEEFAQEQERARRDGDADVREYEESRDRLIQANIATSYLVADIINYAKQTPYDLKYRIDITPSSRSGQTAGAGDEPSKGKGKGKGRFSEGPSQIVQPPRPSGPTHSLSSSPMATSSSAPNSSNIHTISSSSQTSTPEISHHVNSVQAINSAANQTGAEGATHANRQSMKRSVTFMPSSSLRPSVSAGDIENGNGEDGEESYDGRDKFSILRLDVSTGYRNVATSEVTTSEDGKSTGTGSLIEQLAVPTLSRMLLSQLTESISHLQLLLERISSTSSRVLVTGDLNAGKSTFVNALLRRGDEVMPVDQQPLTGRFVEVFGDEEIGTLRGVEKGIVEEVHVPKSGLVDPDLQQQKEDEQKAVEERKKAKGKGKEVGYDRAKEETYDKRQLEDLYELVVDQEANSPPLKVYLKAPPLDSPNPSILHNGILDISLIDAPGLNRDILQTTSNFASSSSIDVIIFVVSAANHFTLSAKEFILSAGKEKARMFIVVNRFDEVRDKERCKRMVLDQIKLLSPGTWEDREELVHFVDSAKVAIGCTKPGRGRSPPGMGESSGSGGSGSGGGDDGDGGEDGVDGIDDMDEAFKRLEQSLRSFVLINRAKSKLGPAETYLTHLLMDLETLSSGNVIWAHQEAENARNQLNRVGPVLQKMKDAKKGMDEELEIEEEAVVSAIGDKTKLGLEQALERISQGQLGATHGKQGRIWMPHYPGLLGTWDYAIEVRKALLESIEAAVYQAQEDTKMVTSEGVARVIAQGNAHLPPDVPAFDRPFNPKPMFEDMTPSGSRPSSPIGGARNMRRNTSSYTVANVGLRFSERKDLLTPHPSDVVNIHRWLVKAQTALTGKEAKHTVESEVSALGVASLAAGAVTVVSGKTLGIKALLSNIVSFSDFIDNDTVKAWALPVVGVLVVGAVGYLIYDLPHMIPRNVGSSIMETLVAEGLIDVQVARTQKEGRKTIRIIAWKSRERFQEALAVKENVVKESEEVEKKAIDAGKYFAEAHSRAEVIKAGMGKSVLG